MTKPPPQTSTDVPPLDGPYVGHTRMTFNSGSYEYVMVSSELAAPSRCTATKQPTEGHAPR